MLIDDIAHQVRSASARAPLEAVASIARAHAVAAIPKGALIFDCLQAQPSVGDGLRQELRNGAAVRFSYAARKPSEAPIAFVLVRSRQRLTCTNCRTGRRESLCSMLATRARLACLAAVPIIGLSSILCIFGVRILFESLRPTSLRALVGALLRWIRREPGLRHGTQRASRRELCAERGAPEID